MLVFSAPICTDVTQYGSGRTSSAFPILWLQPASKLVRLCSVAETSQNSKRRQGARDPLCRHIHCPSLIKSTEKRECRPFQPDAVNLFLLSVSFLPSAARSSSLERQQPMPLLSQVAWWFLHSAVNPQSWCLMGGPFLTHHASSLPGTPRASLANQKYLFFFFFFHFLIN